MSDRIEPPCGTNRLTETVGLAKIDKLEWRGGYVAKWNFLKSNIFIWIFVIGIEKFFLLCECEQSYEQIVEYYIELDDSETEK